MAYSSLFENFLDNKTELHLQMDAMALADTIFIEKLNATHIKQLFHCLENKLSECLCSGEENYFVKGLCFYHYFEQALIWNVEIKKPNELKLDYVSNSENKSLNTYSKQVMVNGLIYQHLPQEEENNFKQFFSRLQGNNFNYFPNLATLEEAKKYCYFEFITGEFQQVYSQLAKFNKQYALSDAIKHITNKQKIFDDSFLIFREKYLLEQNLIKNDNEKMHKLKI
jgi:hypothetical protein